MEEQKGYEVIHFIAHGNLSRITMDYVEGELLVHRIKKMRWITKEQLFHWIRLLSQQMEQFHRCRKKQCYRYLSPESVMVTDEGELYLLDLEAESNAFVIRHMQRREMRRHFVKEELHFQENMRMETDLYSMGKTIQYMLAHLQVEPKLSRKEEHQLTHIIQRCLGTNSKKIYQDLKEIQKDIPKMKDQNVNKIGKQIVAAMGIILAAVLIVHFLSLDKQNAGSVADSKSIGKTAEDNEKSENLTTEEGEGGQNNQNDEEEPNVEELSPVQERLKAMKEDIQKLQAYMQENTTEDNKKIIDEGVELEKELLRYLAIAFDREENIDEALRYYQDLTEIEDNEKQLEIIYLRKAEIEVQQEKFEDAAKTYVAAVSACPQNQSVSLAYVEFICKDSTATEEEKNKILQEIIVGYPELAETEEFQKLQQEYGIKVEGEKLWIEKANE